MSFVASWFGGNQKVKMPKPTPVAQAAPAAPAAQTEVGEAPVDQATGRRNRRAIPKTRTIYGGALTQQAQTARKYLLGG